jgi:DegV family protein with EDD domain
MAIQIVTDSTSDIPAEEAERLGICVVPVVIVLHEQSFRDGLDISRGELYRRMTSTGHIPTTSSPSVGAFAEAYESILQRGVQHILSLHPASALSGIYNSARLAAAHFPGKITVMESGQISLGTGFQVISAAEAAARGFTLEPLRQLVLNTRARVHLIAMINNLNHLALSGRVSTLLAGISNLLQIKILLSVVEGTVNRVAQVRTHTQGLTTLMEMAESWGPLERIAVVHANARTAAELLRAQLMQKLEEMRLFLDRPMMVEITPAIGVHTGPGAVGVIALSQSSQR